MKKTHFFRLAVPAMVVMLTGLANTIFSQSLLWKITGGSSGISYLYGTIHLTDTRVFEWDDSVYSRIEQCTFYAGELDLSPSNLLKASFLMLLPENETLKERFSAPDYEILRKGLKTCSGYDLDFFSRLKPPGLIGLCYHSDTGNNLEATVDEMLYRFAQSKGLVVNGLETIEEQVAMLDHIPDSYIVDYFRHIDLQESETKKLIEYYVSGNLDSLYQMMIEEEPDVMMNQEFITKRNYRMVERALPLLRKQNVFIAVGAGHLPGSEGIIALLRKAGFTVDPVSLFSPR